MENSDLVRLDAAATASAIRAGRITSRRAVEAALARMHAVNPAVNAVVNALDTQALAAADAADAALAQGQVLGPLHGVPITVKINVDLAGQATTNGLVPLRDAIAAEDSIPVANLKKAGAVIIGQTNVPAWCYRWFTSNDLHGTTRNPHDLSLSPGGSSGGAAAAVACGIGTFAHGNDVAGSVRLPASVCGVYGMKATMGRIPSYNPSQPVEHSLGLQLGASEGIIARSVRDIRLGLEALAQPDPRDPALVPAAPPRLDQRLPCRVAVYLGDAGMPVDPEVAAVVRQAADWLQDAGYVVEEIAPPHLVEMSELWMALLYAECTGPVRDMLFAMADEAFRQSFLSTAANLPVLDAMGVQEGWQRRLAIQRAWAVFMARYPLVLTPTACQKPLPIDHDLQSRDTMGEIIKAYRPLPVVAGLGLPAISVPAGFVGGLPVGVQIIGRWFDDERCLAAAEVMETRIGPTLPIDPKTS